MADPMRVAHITGRMRGGGLEQVVVNYYEHIDRSRVQFDFLVEKGFPVVPAAAIRELGGRVFEMSRSPIRIVHCHGTDGKWRGELLRNATKAVLRRFSNVYPTHRMACSRYAEEWLFGKGTDLEVFYNAIDLPGSFDAKARALRAFAQTCCLRRMLTQHPLINPASPVFGRQDMAGTLSSSPISSTSTHSTYVNVLHGRTQADRPDCGLRVRT